jgi:uncharacterized membrane protein
MTGALATPPPTAGGGDLKGAASYLARASHQAPPRLEDELHGVNDRLASLIAKTVGSMWMFYASILAFAVWMAGLGATVAGDHYPFNLMLLAVGGIMQWLAMIAILVAQNAQGTVQDKQVEHLHDLGMTTHRLVVQNTALTQAIHDRLTSGDRGGSTLSGKDG